MKAGLFKAQQMKAGLFKDQQMNVGLFKAQQMKTGLLKAQQMKAGPFKAQQMKAGLFKPQQMKVGLNTEKLCYSESGRPRHTFSLLPSSCYSQMTNLPRGTKGNNLGTGAFDVFIQHACRQYHHMTICAACNVMGVASH